MVGGLPPWGIAIYTLVFGNVSRLACWLGLTLDVTEYTNVVYTNDKNETLRAYMATPPGFENDDDTSWPVALVFPTFTGVGDTTNFFADSLAANAGVVALVIDPYRGYRVSEEINPFYAPWAFTAVATTPPGRVDADIDAALDYLATLDGKVDTTRIVSGPGFCAGGTWAMDLARRRSEVFATVTLYGPHYMFVNPVDRLGLDWGYFGREGTSILGIFGALDASPSVLEVLIFEQFLKLKGVDYNFTTYPWVSHGFVNYADYQAGSSVVIRAWDRVLDYVTRVAASNTTERVVVDAYTEEERAEMRTRYQPSPTVNWRWLVDHATDYSSHKGHGAPHQASSSSPP